MKNSTISTAVIEDIPHSADASEKVTQSPKRPLGLLSEYVVSKLPIDLCEEKSSSYLIAQSEVLASLVSDEEMADDDVPLALLDVTMIESAIRTCAKKENQACSIGLNCKKLLQNLAARRGIIPQLSYEGLIFANPIDTDPRCFLSGDFGRQERLFYRMHAVIEEEFRRHLPAINDALLSRDADSSISMETLLRILDDIEHLLLCITDHMHQLKKVVSREAFNAMRPFFSPSDDFTGPSGKFSAGYFVMDTLLYGCDPTFIPLLKSKLHELHHYPNTCLMRDGFAGQDDMIAAFAAVGKNGDVATLCKHAANSELNEKLQRVLESAEKNRNVHIGLAKRFLPVEYGHGGNGTGESGPLKDYLEKFRNVYTASLQYQS